MMKRKIYLDNNSTTFVLQPIVEAVVGSLNAHEESNPSSVHFFGQRARFRLAEARKRIANCLGVMPNEIIFTSGGTEGVNLLIKGLLQNVQPGHIISSNVEHPCVSTTLETMEKQGFTCSYLIAGKLGSITPDAVEQAIQPNTRLIALMAVNNETGVKTDVEAIAAIAAAKKIPMMLDGVSWFGKERVKIPLGVTGIAFSGHKFHAPKGIGFVVLRNSARLVPQITGGGQEFGKRAGTENLSGIAGLATAVELAHNEPMTTWQQIERLRNRLESELVHRLKGVSINGLGPRVPNTSNLSFAGIEGEALLAALDLVGIAVSHGSACASGALEPSHVLLGMGCSKEEASSSIRFSLSRLTTEEEIEKTIEAVVTIVNKLR